MAQDSRIKGRVTDAQGPLVGVSVKVSGTTTGTLTDGNGEYALNAPSDGTLIFTYIGYVTQKVPISGRTTINVRLASQSQALTEVVVTGYSAQRKKDITGAVAVVDVQAATSIPTGSTSQLLQGQASGVTVISPGAPGSEANVFIRGVSSFGNTQPLIIVDGVQGNLNDINPNDIASVQVLKDAGAASIYGVRGANGVVVITTKKGRTGTPKISYEAYYGVQTPPSGNVFNIMSSQEMSSVWKQVDPTNELYNFRGNGLPDFFYVNNANNGAGGYTLAGDPNVDPVRYRFDESNPNNNYQIAQVNKQGTDWFHEVFNSAPQQSHTLTASGGGENSTYLFSVNYLNQQGTLIETFLKRYAARINTSFNIGKRIRVGENAYIFNRSTNGVNGSNQNAEGTIAMSYRISPVIPVHDIEGNYAGTRLGTALMGNAQNPVAMQELTTNNRNNSWNIQGNLFGELDIVQGLTLRTTFGGTINNQYFTAFNFAPYYNREGFNNNNALQENSVYNSNWTWTNTLNYKNTFGTKHNLTVLAGTEAVNGLGRQLVAGAQGFFLTNIEYLVLSNGTSTITNNSFVTQNTRLFSLFGRADYSYADKYLLGFTLRRDGASVFGSDNRYGVFPSVSLGWRLSQEEFMKNIKWLTDLKLRGSWGKMGSYANVPNTNAFSLYSQQFGTSYYPISGTNQTSPGFWLSNIGNPNTGWEEDIVTNAGFDATLLNNRITMSAEWYKKKVNGLLFPQPLPGTAGAATAPYINIGDIQNTGLDVSVGYNGGGRGKDFSYEVSANITTYKNKIVNLPGGFFDVSNSRLGNLVRNAVGHPIGSFFGYKVAGLFRDAADVSSSPSQADAAPGRFKYEDINGDNQITPDDRTYFGDPNPDFSYGVNLGANYKQFDISAVFYGSQGNQAINYVRYFTDFMGTFTGAKSKALLSAWTPVDRSLPRDQWTASNPNAKTPVAESATFASTSGSFNSYYLENASFLKLRSLQIGYNFQPKQLSRLGIERFRVYVQGANLFTITDYSGIDPELTPSSSNLGSGGGATNPPSVGAFGSSAQLTNAQASAAFGIDYGNYPNNQRSFLLGINFLF